MSAFLDKKSSLNIDRWTRYKWGAWHEKMHPPLQEQISPYDPHTGKEFQIEQRKLMNITTKPDESY